MKKTLLIFVCALVFSSASIAQKQQSAKKVVSPRDATLTVSRIIEHFIQAAGGRTAWLGVKSQYGRGTIYVNSQVVGSVEVYVKAPNKALSIFRLPGGETRNGFDGERSWTRLPRAAAKYDPPEMQELRRCDSDMYKYLNFEKHFPRAKLIGKADVDGIPAYELDAIRADGKFPEKLYFDIRSGFLLRRDSVSLDATSSTLYYGDYREVDGIKMSFSQRIVLGQLVYESRVLEIKNNIQIDDAIFDLPPDDQKTAE